MSNSGILSESKDDSLDDLDYTNLKDSFKIVMEIKGYIVLNDGRVLLKNQDGSLIVAPENDIFAEKIKKLMERKEDKMDVRRIGKIYAPHSNENDEKDEMDR